MNYILSLFPESLTKDDLEPIEIDQSTDTNRSLSDIINENVCLIENNPHIIKKNLDKYLLFHTTQYCLYIWDPSKDLNIKGKTKKNFLGKINLLKNYLKTMFNDDINYTTIYQAKHYVANTRF